MKIQNDNFAKLVYINFQQLKLVRKTTPKYRERWTGHPSSKHINHRAETMHCVQRIPGLGISSSCIMGPLTVIGINIFMFSISIDRPVITMTTRKVDMQFKRKSKPGLT